MNIFKSKSDIARYLECSRPAIETQIKRWDIKQIEIWKVKWYVIVKQFIIYLLESTEYIILKFKIRRIDIYEPGNPYCYT